MITNKITGPSQDIAYKGLFDPSLKNVEATFFGVKDSQGKAGSFVDTSDLETCEEVLDKFESQVLNKVKSFHRVLIHIDLESIREAEGVTEY